MVYEKNLFLFCFLASSLFAKTQNVGIGTLAPLCKLHVYNGASGATPFAFAPLVVESNGHTYINLLSPAANETAILFGQAGSSANGVIMYNNSSTLNGFQFRNNGNLTRMVIYNNGNVGIATLSPSEKLEVTGNVKASNYVYTTPKTLYYSLSGIDFEPLVSSDTSFKAVGSGDITLLTTNTFRKVVAPVHLPHGAVLQNMTVYVIDNSVTDNLLILLSRKLQLDNFAADNLGFVISAGSTGISTAYPTSLGSNVVDNSVNTYYLYAGLNNSPNPWTGNIYLRGVIIQYTLPSAQ
ncbi:MAG: hypothetical protein JWR72_2009 [Flavisolibacter sp.]|nr:hypothetical protein [Flavisolibacter sp.]